MISDVIKRLSYALFPRRCNLCGEVVALSDERCDDCRKQHRITGETCEICGCEKEQCSCPKHVKKPAYKQIIAPYYFEDSIVKAVHRFKFYGYTELARSMADEIVSAVNDKYQQIQFDAVTYIPMTKKKFRKRGYNQSQLLAKEIADRLKLPLSDMLVKIIETSSQRGSTAKERARNLYGAFDIADDAELTGKTILLIDDVKTTGSTLDECSATMKSAGAEVYCAVLSVVKQKEKTVKQER